MTLKSGVTFHDGDPLTSEAVKFTFDRFKKDGKASPIYGGVMQIAAVEAPDPQTVIFRFKAPAANFFSTISMPYAGIIDPKSVQVAAGSEAVMLRGSGPFKLGEWKAGQYIELVRNDAYKWGSSNMTNTAAPKVERLMFKVIPDATTQLNALKAGEVDVIFVNNPGHKKQLEADPNVEVHEAVLNSLVYLGFNTAKAPYDNPQVRQALSHAIDKQQILDVALGGVGQVADAPLPPTLPGYDPSLKESALGFDLAKSQELLAAAGLHQGRRRRLAVGGQAAPAAVAHLHPRAERRHRHADPGATQGGRDQRRDPTTRFQGRHAGDDRGQVRLAALPLRLERPGRAEHLPRLGPDWQHEPGGLQERTGRRAAQERRA